MRPGRDPLALSRKGGPSEVGAARGESPDVGPTVYVLRGIGGSQKVLNEGSHNPILWRKGSHYSVEGEMTWTAPPKGSPADRVLDALGQLGRPDWVRACRWCPGWNASGTERLAERAARGGDPRLAWYREVLEAGDREASSGSRVGASESASPPKEEGAPRKVGRPWSEKGRLAYEARARGGTWALIAREVGLSDAGKGNVAKKAARRHAERHSLPWPIARDARRSTATG